jgi:hypothetical protein
MPVHPALSHPLSSVAIVTSIGGTILAEAYRAQGQRDTVLEHTRARAAWTLAAASLAAGVLVASHQPSWAFGTLAGLSLAVLVFAVVVSCWPREWRDTSDVGELVRNFVDTDEPGDLVLLERDLAVIHYQLYLDHAKPLRVVQLATIVAMIALGAFVFLLLIDRML